MKKIRAVVKGIYLFIFYISGDYEIIHEAVVTTMNTMFKSNYEQHNTVLTMFLTPDAKKVYFKFNVDICLSVCVCVCVCLWH